MNKLCLFISYALLFLTPHSIHAQEESANDYSEQDRHKAIIMCMTAEYVQFYHEHPAEDDAMDICNSRFEQLRQEIPYEDYKKWVLETPYSPYPATESSEILEKYSQIMLGVDAQPFLIN